MSEEKTQHVDKTITETSPSINKVILLENGRGGLKVKYNIGQTINGVMNNKKRAEEVNRPVHKEVRDGFLSLRYHLLKSCGYYWPNEKMEEMLTAKCVVTTIVVDKKDQLQVSGYMLMNGRHHAAIASPFLTRDDYADFHELNELVDSISEQSKLFMLGTKSAAKREIVIDYLIVKKEMGNAEEAYAAMSDDELAQITKEALSDSGLQVIMEDGVEVLTTIEEEDDNQLEMAIEEGESEYSENPVVSEEIEEAEFEEPAKTEVTAEDEDIFTLE